MWRWPLASQKYAPCARATKRGVPPTALKARTGEFTPPGISRLARSNSCWFRSMFGVMGGHVEDLQGLRFLGSKFCGFAFGLGPEQAVGHHVAHAGAKARVKAPVEVSEGFSCRRNQVGAARNQCRERGRQRVAG